MTDCCSNAACEIEKLQTRQSRTLKIVLAVNTGMFLVEFAAGLTAASTALLADSLDMLGDAFVYGFSLYVVSRNNAWKAVSALIKGGIMALFGLFVNRRVSFGLPTRQPHCLAREQTIAVAKTHSAAGRQCHPAGRGTTGRGCESRQRSDPHPDDPLPRGSF